MARKTLQRLAATISAGLLLAAISTATQATHSWGGYHWARTTNPFT